MKKMLNFFVVNVLIITSAFYAVACSIHPTTENSKEELKFWENNYQYGPKKVFKTKSASENPYIDYFFGKPEFNYATYLVNADSVENSITSEEVVFNGDLENVKRTPVNQSDLKLWKNDTQSTQLILFKENESKRISDLKIDILNPVKEIEISAKFIKPVKARNTVNNKYNPASPKAVFYNYDEIATNELDLIKFDFQPILITAKTNDKTEIGVKKINFKLSFKANNVEQEIIFHQNLNIVDKTIERSDEAIDAVSSDSMSFPTSSQKFVLKQFDKVVTKKTIILNQSDYNNLTSFSEQKIIDIIKANNISMPSDVKLVPWKENLDEESFFRIDKDNKHISVLIKSNSYFVVNKEANKISGQDNPDDIIQIYFNNPNSSKSKSLLKEANKSVYDKPTFSPEAVTAVLSNPEKNYSRLTAKENTLHDFLVKEKKENEDRSLNNKYGKAFTNLQKENNAKYGYVPNFGLGYIKYIAEIKEIENVDEFWSAMDQKNLSRILDNQKLDWTINFDIFDEYIKFLYENGYKKLFMPVVARNANPFNFYYKTAVKNVNESGGNKDQKVLANITYKNKFIDDKGNPTEDWNTFVDKIIPLLTQQLVSHINKAKKVKDSDLSKAYKDIQIYYSFDETNQEINENIISKFSSKNDAQLIKTHAYIGWQFKVDDYYNTKELEKKFKPYDEITLQQREYIFNYEKGNQNDVNNFRKLVDDRQSEGKNTRFYSSWQNFPGGYLSSVPGDLTWSTLMAYKYNTNGFDRFQLDGFYTNDISLDGYILGNPHEPTDSSLIYPGDKDNIYDSLRLVNLQNGIKMVWKLITLEKKGLISPNDITKIKNYIRWNNEIRSNIDYKWTTNLNDSISINSFEEKNDSVYMQIFKIKEYINNLS